VSGAFQILEGEHAVIREGGVYKEVDIAVRNNGELYVKAKGGFIRLYADGSTSVGSKCTVDTLAIDAEFHKDSFGKLCVAPGKGRKPLSTPPKFLALEDKA
jgi:hypothetical protein